jgi:glycosyltransferase involved in cell wall biosynthesis
MTSTTESAADAAVDVSVVVPTCGRLDLLDRSLDALMRQDLPPAAYEVIVVDDEPNRNTLQLVAGWRARTHERGPRLRYVANEGPHGPAAARNRGWRLAAAPIIAFTDDDTVPSPGWLRHGLAGFTPDIDVLCGRVVMPLPRMPTDYQRDASQLESAELVTANCFCRKRVLEALDGFDERFRLAWREDSDLHFRLLKICAGISHSHQALVIHPVRPAPWGASLVQLRKIRFDALLYKKHPELYRQKIRSMPRWDYYAIVVALLAALLGLGTGNEILAVTGAGAWLVLTSMFCIRRLRGTAKTVSHVAEMLVTSALIPPLAVFWRLIGAIQYRVRFA